MSKLRFKVGDKARIIDKRCKYYGEECTILEVLTTPKKHICKKTWDKSINQLLIYDYIVKAKRAVKKGHMPDSSLEPLNKTGIQETASWEEIQKICNWNPTKILSHTN